MSDIAKDENAKSKDPTPRVLVLDVGNTNTVIGVYKDDKLLGHWRLISERHTADELGIYLTNLLKTVDIHLNSFDGAILSSVVPSLDIPWRDGVKHYLGVECMIVSTDLDLGIEVLYGAPKEVGADRLVNAVAGVARYGSPLIIVDFGTAITLDYVGPGGKYMGGAIAPGLEVSMEALFGRTAKLPRIALDAPPPSVVGKNTVDSIKSGILFGYVGLVDALVERIWDECGGQAKVIGTGGHAHLIAAHSKYMKTVEPWLTLEGLKLIYERNTSRR
ncbi:MAG TPA: type III pantothenate kinase [Thermosynergistes sp.]|nr:type III pantothenate kinase [Thermosynergistes sp.]